MDSPVRQYLKQKDYRRHKLFRKINRRRKAERLLAIDAPMKELKKRLRRFGDGKDEKKVYLDQSIDGVNLWRDNLTGGYFYLEGNGPRIDLTPFNTLGSDDPTTWSFLDAEGKEYNPRRLHTGSKISQTTDAQRVANEVRDILNTRTWRSDVADKLHNFGDALLWSTMAMNPEGEALMMNASEKLASLGRLAKPMFNKTALAIENYRYPFGRPQVPEGYITVKPQIRTRIGDVEIDNPNLLYHLDRGDSAGAFSNQGAYVKDGRLLPGIAKEGEIPYSWWNLGRPYATSVNGQPMTRLMTTTKDTPGMLHIRSQNYPIGQWNGKRGLVTNAEYVNPEGVSVSESTYTLDPDYGWRRVFTEDAPTAKWADAVKTPQITAENATSITPEQWTAAQDAAIARGDMAEAQRLRDLHFQVSAPNTVASVNGQPLQLYHGTDATFNAFDISKYGNTDGGTFGRGIYTTPVKTYAELYGENNMPLYMKLDNPRDYSNSSIGDLIAEKFAFGDDFATGNGIDGVIGRPSWKGFKGLEEYISHNPKNIKSSLPITYDDNGVRIPLGERDNFNINDIRYGLLPFGIGLGTFGALYGTSDNSTFNKGKDSGIHIKPLNRGKFTALKKRTGKSASWFKAHGTPALKKMATFALNSRHWKHK